MNEKDENKKDLFNFFLQKIWRRFIHILKAGFPDESPESESVQAEKNSLVSGSRNGLKRALPGKEEFSGKESVKLLLPEEEAESRPDRIRERDPETSRQEPVSDDPELFFRTGTEPVAGGRADARSFPFFASAEDSGTYYEKPGNPDWFPDPVKTVSVNSDGVDRGSPVLADRAVFSNPGRRIPMPGDEPAGRNGIRLHQEEISPPVSIPYKWTNENEKFPPFSLPGTFLKDPVLSSVISIPAAVESMETKVPATGNDNIESFSGPFVNRRSVFRIPSSGEPESVHSTVPSEEQAGMEKERSLYEQALAKLISPQEKPYEAGKMDSSQRSFRTGEGKIGEDGFFSLTEFPFHFSAESRSVQDLLHTGSRAGEFFREKSVYSGETAIAGMDGKKSTDLLAEKMKESVKLLNNINSSCENLKQIVTEGMNI